MECNTIQYKVMGDFRPPFLLDEEANTSAIVIVSQYMMRLEPAISNGEPESNERSLEWSITTSMAGIRCPTFASPVVISTNVVPTPTSNATSLCNAGSGHRFIVSVRSECFRFHKEFNLLRFFFDFNIYFHVTQMRIRAGVGGRVTQYNTCCNATWCSNVTH